ncbi:MAG: hypothetical protein ACRENE_11695, partial [Polyangiaceae bacterium]
ARQWSLWPSVASGYGTLWGDTFGALGSTHYLFTNVYLPVLFHPAPHFFIGLGPEASTSFLEPDRSSSTRIAFNATVGGWAGL